jgi:hypothetical protein
MARPTNQIIKLKLWLLVIQQCSHCVEWLPSHLSKLGPLLWRLTPAAVHEPHKLLGMWRHAAIAVPVRWRLRQLRAHASGHLQQQGRADAVCAVQPVANDGWWRLSRSDLD